MRKTQAGILFILFFANSLIQAAPIDISETTGGFVTSDPSLVSFGPGINEAVLLEDSNFGVTYLSNDPFLGDPGISIPNNITDLSFDYDFSTTGEDTFEVNLLDPNGGSQLFSFIFDSASTGSGNFSGNDITIDLVSLGIPGTTIGLEFVLSSNINDSTQDAILNISDVRLNTSSGNIPEPSGLLLISLITGVSLLRRRKLS